MHGPDVPQGQPNVQSDANQPHGRDRQIVLWRHVPWSVFHENDIDPHGRRCHGCEHERLEELTLHRECEHPVLVVSDTSNRDCPQHAGTEQH
ncbi:MAG: hypothetical protein WAR37_04480 [Candidatus Microsaccharimonas sp.]